MTFVKEIRHICSVFTLYVQQTYDLTQPDVVLVEEQLPSRVLQYRHRMMRLLKAPFWMVITLPLCRTTDLICAWSDRIEDYDLSLDGERKFVQQEGGSDYEEE